MDIQYIEGVVKVHLSQLFPEAFVPYNVPHTTNIAELLRDPQHIIEGRITSRSRDNILGTLGWSASQLLNSQDTPLITSEKIFCSTSNEILQTAKQTLGANFLCKIRLYCIPPKPRNLSDGVVFRNIRYYVKERRYLVADAWLEKLSPCKQRILRLVMRRKPILDAMEGLLPYHGLWEGLQIGNWAKHLAMHDDELLINYWNYMTRHWKRIMEGLESKCHLIDHNSVLRIQRRAPALVTVDRDCIISDFASKTNPIFPRISQQEDRARLEQNILSLAVAIPSIETFHDNTRYITIGAKILEKHIQMKPRRVSNTSGSHQSLFKSLSADWIGGETRIQTKHREFKTLPGTTTARLAYMQLFIAALRYFPFLSSEPPLQDIKGACIGAQINQAYLGLLCRTAKKLGFSNAKIEAGFSMDRENALLLYSEPEKTLLWRGGKPPYLVFQLLHQRSFLAQLFSEEFQPSNNMSVLQVQSDMLKAFFGGVPDISPTTLVNNLFDATSSPIEPAQLDRTFEPDSIMEEAIAESPPHESSAEAGLEDFLMSEAPRTLNKEATKKLTRHAAKSNNPEQNQKKRKEHKQQRRRQAEIGAVAEQAIPPSTTTNLLQGNTENVISSLMPELPQIADRQSTLGLLQNFTDWRPQEVIEPAVNPQPQQAEMMQAGSATSSQGLVPNTTAQLVEPVVNIQQRQAETMQAGSTSLSQGPVLSITEQLVEPAVNLERQQAEMMQAGSTSLSQGPVPTTAEQLQQQSRSRSPQQRNPQKRRQSQRSRSSQSPPARDPKRLRPQSPEPQRKRNGQKSRGTQRQPIPARGIGGQVFNGPSQPFRLPGEPVNVEFTSQASHYVGVSNTGMPDLNFNDAPSPPEGFSGHHEDIEID